MRIIPRQPEVSPFDPRIMSFDDEMSDAMADGLMTIWQVQANAKGLRKAAVELGSETAVSSDSLIEHASAILTSSELDKLAEEGDLDPEQTDKFLSKASRELSPHDAVAAEALAKMGYLALLSGAEEAVISKIDKEWQEEYASRIVGRDVLIWKPAGWNNPPSSDATYRHNAPYTSTGHGITNMNIGEGNVVTGTVEEVSLRENGRVTLVDGINSYERLRRGNTPPKQISPRIAMPWDQFNWFQARDIFQPDRDDPKAWPKIRIELL